MDFEKLGAFYLGKEFDPRAGKVLEDRLVLYDARDLTTHAVCLGMTGSGKTGLCIDLLEEAAIDHVPALIIDPKGDITNLLLQFPELRPEDFRPWINPEDALRKGLTLDAEASRQAQLWRDGLARWGQDGQRIRMLRESADFTIYTPGSESGIPVSVLHSFSAPPRTEENTAEAMRERIEITVTALLQLIGVEADPIRSREHILLANIFEYSWSQGLDLDFRTLILAIQTPPMDRLGVFDLDTFFPQSDRFELAMRLNGLVAAPSFASWMQGVPLDVGSFLSTPEGRPRHSVFYIAHLNDAERLFFVTMLLNQLIAWMRTQPGTTSLRALCYMDEIFGFFPPVANPPSKKPMLTLLKQARAFGVGLVLATQNPVDLDYKGLSNAGTWFIGRLQTERDRERVLDGLVGAAATGGRPLERSAIADLIAGLGERVFLLHNVHESGPIVFQTRWAMSFLRGPLTRPQISELMHERRAGQAESIEAPPSPGRAHRLENRVTDEVLPADALARYAASVPTVAPGVDQVFLPPVITEAAARLEARAKSGRAGATVEGTILYRPGLLALARVAYLDRRRGVDFEERRHFVLPVSDEDMTLDWQSALPLDADLKTSNQPEPGARFDRLPRRFNEEKEIRNAMRDLADHLYRSCRLTLLRSTALGTFSQPGEDRRDFILRLTQSAREARDQEVDQLRQKYDRRLDQMMDRLRRAETALAKKEADAQARKRELLTSVGESVLGMFLGRRSLRAASSSLGKYRMQTASDLARKEAEEKVEDLQGDVDELKRELKEQADVTARRWEEAAQALEEVTVTPRRTDVSVDRVSIGWIPCWVFPMEAAPGHPGDLVEVPAMTPLR
jgi:hypothetical protein